MSEAARDNLHSLPIYQRAMAVAVAVDASVSQFPRRHKYAVGQELRRHSGEALAEVVAAYRVEQRAEALERLCRHVDRLQVYVQLAHEVKAFSAFSVYAGLASQVVDLARQAQGWRRHSRGSPATIDRTPQGVRSRPERSGAPDVRQP